MKKFSISKSAPGFAAHADYVLVIIRSPSLHQLILNEAVIAASSSALVVREQDLRDIIYIPRSDILVPLPRMKGQSSYCPFKGTASYWGLEANGSRCEKAAWSYDDPYDDVARLRGYIAFYANKLDCHWRNGVEQPLWGPGRLGGQERPAVAAARPKDILANQTHWRTCI